jgi:hypothetical protein
MEFSSFPNRSSTSTAQRQQPRGPRLVPQGARARDRRHQGAIAALVALLLGLRASEIVSRPVAQTHGSRSNHRAAISVCPSRIVRFNAFCPDRHLAPDEVKVAGQIVTHQSFRHHFPVASYQTFMCSRFAEQDEQLIPPGRGRPCQSFFDTCSARACPSSR